MHITECHNIHVSKCVHNYAYSEHCTVKYIFLVHSSEVNGFWSLSLQVSKRNTVDNAVLLNNSTCTCKTVQ